MLQETDDDFLFEEDKMSQPKDAAVSNEPLLKINDDDDEQLPQVRSVQLDPPLAIEQPSITFNDLETAIRCVSQENNNVTAVADDKFRQKFELDRLGMEVTTGSVVINKDESNLIGISIGGGAPMCPCLYIVQVFDGTPAAREGSLQSGDELLAVNSVSVKGKTKVEVAKMIQSTSSSVTIHYNKLHANVEQGKSLDIYLKKLKHRLVDSMSSTTADTLGLSRAILCNDSLVKRLEELEGTELMYKGLVEHARRMLKAYYDLIQTYKSFGDTFTQISVREPQQRASEAFRTFGEFHRNLEKDGVKILKQIKPVLDDIGTYLNKAIPDTKLTVNRYADAKFTYLSYCLKVKEMDDEEHGFAAIQEPLYRVETGNYEYRLILRCRQDARSKFAKLRTDVLEKMELLESKHATDLNKQLRSLLDSLANLNRSVVERMEVLPQLFPIEVDFKETDFQYKSSTLKPQDMDDEEEVGAANFSTSDVHCGQEALEQPAQIINIQADNNQRDTKSTECLLDGIEDAMQNIAVTTPEQSSECDSYTADSNEQLLIELGLFGIDLTASQANMCDNASSSKSNDAFNFDLFLNQALPTKTELERDLMAANSCEMDLILQ